MKKRIVGMVLTLVMVLSLVPAFSISAFAASDTVTSKNDSRIDYMLKNIEYQNFSGSGITSEQAKNYIKHFIFDSSFAAVGGGTFNYPNSGAYTWHVTDGTYARDIRGSTGCCAYCYYVSKVIYGVDWVDSAKQTKIYSASQLKSFLLTYAQAGEHLRADPTHSVTFISGDDEGFYCLSYCGDSNPVIHLDYWTYEAYYSRYSGYSIYVYDVFKSDNTSTWSCKNGHQFNYNVVTAPTKTAAGKLRCYCPVCRSTQEVTLPKLNASEYTVTTIGTTSCTSGAVERYTWKVTEYGRYHFDVQLSAGSHSYTYSVAAEPTETAEGSIKGYCSKCQSTVYYTVPKLNAADFNYKVIGEASCTKGCTGHYTWKNTQYGSYNFDIDIPPMGHTYCVPEFNKVTAVPTAESQGELECRCLRCNDKMTLTLPKFSDTEYSYTVKKYPSRYEGGTGTYTWLVEEFGDYSFDVSLPVLKPGDNPFTDVNSGSVYYDAILWAYYHEPQQITGGFTDHEFYPRNPCTRAQVVTFLWRAMGCPEPTTTNNPFSDVSAKQASGKDNPYYKAILWAAEKGITTGYNGGLFKPNDTVTRGQFVTFLYRAEGKPATSGSIYGFKDASSIASPYRSAVAWAVEKGITTGYEDNTFRPNDACTRWAVVLFMYRDMK